MHGTGVTHAVRTAYSLALSLKAIDPISVELCFPTELVDWRGADLVVRSWCEGYALPCLVLRHLSYGSANKSPAYRGAGLDSLIHPLAYECFIILWG